MDELTVSAALVGQRVAVPHRPEWGVGTVLRVQTTAAGGPPQHRVSIHFATGHRTLLVPPARLITPAAEPERAAGWLDTLAGRTVDDRLARLPDALAAPGLLPAEQIAALVPLYELTEEPACLLRWARRQANVADPLSLWSRDELAVAFRQFCIERDSALRLAAARVVQAAGADALAALLERQAPAVAAALRAALARPI